MSKLYMWIIRAFLALAFGFPVWFPIFLAKKENNSPPHLVVICTKSKIEHQIRIALPHERAIAPFGFGPFRNVPTQRCIEHKTVCRWGKNYPGEKVCPND